MITCKQGHWGLCHKELDLNAELAAHLNDAWAAETIKQATKAIKEAEACHATTAYTLQQTHRGRVLALEHQIKAEESQNHQAFVEAFRVVIQACPPENWGTLLYPYNSQLAIYH